MIRDEQHDGISIGDVDGERLECSLKFDAVYEVSPLPPPPVLCRTIRPCRVRTMIVIIYVRNETTAWNLPIPSTRTRIMG